MARPSEEVARLDSVHRGAAGRSGLCGFHVEGSTCSATPEDGTQLYGDIHERPSLRPARLRHDSKRDDQEAGFAVFAREGLSALRRQAPETRVPVGALLRPGRRRAVTLAFE